MKKPEKEYETGDAAADGMIRELAKRAGSALTEPLMREILTTAVKLGMESGDTGDLKLVNNALKELRYSFKIFSPYRDVKKVIIFGSARSQKTSPEYRMAEEFARRITAKGHMVITGGGPGVMEAGNKGALKGKEFALNIRLPYEQRPNPFIDEKDKIINYKYFFVRKLTFIKESDAAALFPGGFGTHDEGFELLTLMQTGKAQPRPIVMMEPEGSAYWGTWKRFVDRELFRPGFISGEDYHLFRIAKSVDEAVSFIEEFYRIYHSIRYVGGLTVIRLNREPSGKTLKLINRKFAGILTGGDIRSAPPTKKEIEENDHVELPRLVMKFNRRNYGRLYEMIGVINRDGENHVKSACPEHEG